MRKKWLIMISFIAVEIAIYVIYSFWNELLVFFLAPLPMLFLILIIYTQNKRLSLEVEECEKQVKQLKEEVSLYQKKEDDFNNLMTGLNVITFSFNVKENNWLLTENFQNYLGNDGDFQKGISMIENMIHPEDKEYFLKKKHAILSGNLSTFEFRTMLEDKQIHWNELRTSVTRNSSNEDERIVGILTDITQRKEKEEKLEQMAYYDTLTELPNRTMLQSHLKKAFSRAKRKKHQVTIMFIDLDGFKEVNDTFGHDVGDMLLKEVANRLNNSIREEDLLSRLGGDEFIIVFEETTKDEVASMAERLVTTLSPTYFIMDHTVSVTPSIGISTYPVDGDNLQLIITNADKAMYYAKAQGKGNYQFYSPSIDDYQPRESLLNIIFKWFQK